jgi:zinc protease
MKQARWSIFLFCLGILLLAVQPAWSEEQAAECPEGAALMEKFIEAIGGEASAKKIHNRVTKGTMKMPMQGMEGFVTVYEAEPNKQYAIVSLGAAGTLMRGSNGEVVWEMPPGQPPQIKEGEDLKKAIQEATFNDFLHWRTLYSKIECVGVETEGDQTLYQVDATPIVGAVRSFFFDRDSGLMAKLKKAVETPGGTLPVMTSLEDYRDVDGLLMPFKTTESVMGMNIEFTATSIAHNAEIPADRFDLPKPVQDQLAKNIEAAEAEVTQEGDQE